MVKVFSTNKMKLHNGKEIANEVEEEDENRKN